MSGNDEDANLDDLNEMLRTNSRARGHGDYWNWRDKPEGEYGAAKSVLTDAGLNPIDLHSLPPGEDPPDLEAKIEGKLCGIEVTELVHQEALEKSIKDESCYYPWDRGSLCAKIQGIIDVKDRVSPPKNYDRYLLIIVTDEFTLNKDDVDRFLCDATFGAELITDAYLGLSYHPAASGDGSCPVFKLTLVPRSQ